MGLRHKFRLKWLATGNNIPTWVYRVFSSPAAAIAIAVLAFVLGLAGTVFTTEIRDSTKLMIKRVGPVDRRVLSFWLASFLWAFLFYVRLIAEADEKKHTERAIERCPNPRVLRIYREFYENVVAILKDLSDLDVNDANLAILEERLTKALWEILDFARIYADPVPNAPRGCNVMMVATAGDIPKKVKDSLLFASPLINVESLRAVLFVAPKLIVSSGTAAHISAIALPVPAGMTGKLGTMTVLPGAPYALLSGKLSVHRDTRRISEDDGYKGQDGETRAALAEYFSATGAGKHVRSFASIRVGDGDNPIAVLNLDYSEPGLLGDDDYYGTFFALISPVLFLFRGPLDLYGKMLRSLGSLD